MALGGDLTRAALLDGYVAAVYRAHGYEREFTEQTTQDRLRTILVEGLAAPELARLTGEGAALTGDAAIALALTNTL